MIIRPRCGFCIDGLHKLCLVSIMMGTDNRRGRPKDRTYQSEKAANKAAKKEIRPYLWRCGCHCDYATGTVSAGLED